MLPETLRHPSLKDVHKNDIIWSFCFGLFKSYIEMVNGADCPENPAVTWRQLGSVTLGALDKRVLSL